MKVAPRYLQQQPKDKPANTAVENKNSNFAANTDSLTKSSSERQQSKGFLNLKDKLQALKDLAKLKRQAKRLDDKFSRSNVTTRSADKKSFKTNLLPSVAAKSAKSNSCKPKLSCLADQEIFLELNEQEFRHVQKLSPAILDEIKLFSVELQVALTDNLSQISRKEFYCFSKMVRPLIMQLKSWSGYSEAIAFPESVHPCLVMDQGEVINKQSKILYELIINQLGMQVKLQKTLHSLKALDKFSGKDLLIKTLSDEIIHQLELIAAGEELAFTDPNPTLYEKIRIFKLSSLAKGAVAIDDQVARFKSDDGTSVIRKMTNGRLTTNFTTVYVNHNLYEGEVDEFMRPHGSGVLIEKDFRVISSNNYVNGSIYGSGQISFKDGPCYDGELSNSQAHGQGKIYFSAQSKIAKEFSGIFKQGVPQIGILTTWDKQKIVVKYQNQQFVPLNENEIR